MLSSTVRTVTDVDDYRDAIRPEGAEVTITGRGPFMARVTNIDLHHIWVQRGQETLPRISHAARNSGRATIWFRTQPGSDMVWNGITLGPTEIALHRPGEASCQRLSGPAQWGSVSVPADEMNGLSADAGRSDVMRSGGPLTVVANDQAMSALRRLHAAAGYLAEHAPDILLQPEAARDLAHALTMAWFRCLDGSKQQEETEARRHHAVVIARFRAVLEANAGAALFLPEFCREVGVSARTLRLCCHEHYGMGPTRFLLLRRLHLARDALVAATPASTTVTEIATRFGFWELGRFSVRYRSLFNERPSATLRRSPRSSLARSSWRPAP